MRQKKNKFVALMTGALLATGFGVVGMATPVVPASSASAAAAPTCMSVALENNGYNSATITNNCNKTMRVKAIWAFGPDSPCWTYGQGSTGTSVSGVSSSFDGLVIC